MTETLDVGAREVEEGTASLQRSWQLTRTVLSELSPRDVRTGRWFPQLLSIYLRHYDAHRMHVVAAAKGTTAETTEKFIRQACEAAFLTGAGSGSVTTGITATWAEAGAAGLMVAIPTSGLVITTEMLVRALIHLRLACDLASAFDVRFDPEDPSDFSRLYAILRGGGPQPTDEDPLGLGRVEHLVHTKASDLGEALGAKLLGDSVARNMVPFLNVVTSSVDNWRRTRRLGDSMLRYVRLRRAFEDADAALRHVAPRSVSLLLESAWFVFVSDGRLSEEETAVLTHELAQLTQERRRETLGRFVDDTSEWLQRLRSAPASAREVLLESLNALAAADLAVTGPERDLLHKAAQALHTSLDSEHLDTLVRRYRKEGVGHARTGHAHGALRAHKAVREQEAPAPLH